jgi:glycosyltransferase involved in cell wall biosynthesis
VSMHSMTRVLFVTPRFSDGGGERIWLSLLEGLDRSRFKPALAFFEHVDSHFLKEVPADVPTYDLGQRRRFALDWLRLTFRLATLIREERPDVVVSLLHTWGIVLHLARVISRKRFAILVNEHIHVSGSLRSLRNKRPLLSQPSRWLHRYCYRNADLVVPVARDVADDLISNHGARTDRVKTIYNGIDLDRVRRMAREEVDHPWFTDCLPIVIGIGRLTEQKGFDLLIKAFKDALPHSQAKLVILGEGERRSQLEGLIADSGLDKHVALPGRQSNPYKYLARSALFVLSSVGEALPTVLLEAMALGVPIVSTRCPSGPEELLERGECGILVPVGDRKALCSAMIEALENDGLRMDLAQRARAKADTFRLRTMVKAYEACMEELRCRLPEPRWKRNRPRYSS